MTKQERNILEKLTENPLLSQSELAEMLNITRSSVSVYISHLMQMGYIRGRGYLIEDYNTLFVIGTAAIDYHTSIPDDALLTGGKRTAIMDDNELVVYYGGIGKNLAENLSRFGDSVSCVCAVGSDVQGKELLDECRQTGFDVSDALIVPGAKSSTYLEIRSVDKSRIILSSANMKLQQQLTPAFLKSKSHKLRHARAIIVEDSLSTESLQYISSSFSPVPTMLVCSKVTRINRFAHFLNQFSCLVASLEIAWLILDNSGSVPDDDSSVFSIATRLSVKVNGPVLLSYGKCDFAFSDGHHTILCCYSDPLDSASFYSHYRDSVAAGFFHCLLEGADSEYLIKYVCACRHIISQSPNLVNPQMCPELIDSIIQSKQFNIRYNPLY